MNTCAICFEKTDRIVSRCSCGDASIVCLECFSNYWELDCCEYKDDFLSKFKCPICKNVDKRQQLSCIFNDVSNGYFSHFFKGKMKIIKFLEDKISNIFIEEHKELIKKTYDLKLYKMCDCCAELWDDCTCLCHNCDSDYKICKGECY